MQGFNMGRYVPPEYEGTTSANKLAGKHALGNRARKSGQGILTVRFEMPFAIWCTNCPNETIIGQGVRFNAEKKKVGNYYSTPIFSFRMKHVPCGGWIEIQTDPQNTAYKVTEGARKRDTGEDKVLEGDIEIRSEEERERLRKDAFAALEVTIEHRGQAKIDGSRIEELRDFKDKHWDDVYAANRRLRSTFREERKVREQAQEKTSALQDRMSLGIDLLDETDEDRKRAALIDFGEDTDRTLLHRVKSSGIFSHQDKPSSSVSKARHGKTSEEYRAEAHKSELQRSLRSNTRAVIDPFTASKITPTLVSIPGLKRKRSMNSHEDIPADGKVHSEGDGKLGKGDLGLVNYSDDSE